MFCPECGDFAGPGPLKAPYIAPEGGSSGSFKNLLLREGLRRREAKLRNGREAEGSRS